MGLFEWYFSLPPWLRLCCAVVPLGISTVMWFDGWVWPWGWVVGAVMLLGAFPTRGEKNKWGDW